jgi:hypothetical protein
MLGPSEISTFVVVEGFGYGSDMDTRFPGDRLGRFRRSLRQGVVGGTASASIAAVEMTKEREQMNTI